MFSGIHAVASFGAQILLEIALSLTVTEILSDKIQERAVTVYQDVRVGYGKSTENHPFYESLKQARPKFLPKMLYLLRLLRY